MYISHSVMEGQRHNNHLTRAIKNMLRYKTETRPGLVAYKYDIRPGNGAGQFLQSRSLHGALIGWIHGAMFDATVDATGYADYCSDCANLNQLPLWQQLQKQLLQQLQQLSPGVISVATIGTTVALTITSCTHSQSHG